MMLVRAHPQSSASSGILVNREESSGISLSGAACAELKEEVWLSWWSVADEASAAGLEDIEET